MSYIVKGIQYAVEQTNRYDVVLDHWPQGKSQLTALIAYLSLVTVVSVATFVVYGVDKRQAANGGRRIPEQTLHLLALLGGWPGALLGQKQFRHKTQKFSFLVMFWLTVVIHSVVVGVAYTLFNRSS